MSEEKPPAESVKSKKQELEVLITIMKNDMDRMAGIGKGLSERCDDMLSLLKDLSEPSVPAAPKEICPNYVT